MACKLATVLALIAISITTGCQGMSKQPSNADSKLEQAVSQALAVDDFRLYYTTGRRPVVPGFEQLAFKELKARCGVKAMPGTGDTLRSEADKKARSEAYHYARAFNIKMYEACLNRQ
ncbi:hypothetical protein [Pseudoalteromonas rubra]|uniref:Lipoprotein n=1 Tax=Pseudoalteromonas rubra TaxID=43658 RepID=A0A5S3WXV5_9GAMM|nr:hypothetical protein [Pseudoalteromonas rubra]TMP35031.1 hypothetical protein CWB98_17085 [Pseudoalteromonas rubra]